MRIGIVAVAGLMVGVGAACGQKGAVVTGPPVSVDPQAKTPSVTSGPAVQVQPRYMAVAAGCPGSLQARQQATGGATVWTTALEDERDNAALTAQPGGLGIHVEFLAPKTAVKALELRVSYMPLGLHVMPLASQFTNGVEQTPQEKAKTFSLDREAAMRIGGNLLVGPAATITHVHLLSATFADGSVWHAPDDDACTIVPSRFMLVDAKK